MVPEFFTKPWPEFEASVIQQMDSIGRQQRLSLYSIRAATFQEVEFPPGA